MQFNRRIIYLCLVVFFSLVGSGCVSNAERITEMQPSAIQPDANVGVIWISPCSNNSGCKKSGDASNLGQFTPDGANGLLIYGAVMSAHSDVIDALDRVSADALVEQQFLTPVASALEARGAIPKVMTEKHYQGDLSRIGKHSVMRLRETLNELHPESAKLYHAFGFDFNFDLSAIAEELDSSVLVVLHLQEYGVRRSFGPLGVPLGRPYGLSMARAYVWDAATKSVMYNDYGIAQASIGEKWRQTDNLAKVLTATDAALELALERAASPLITALK